MESVSVLAEVLHKRGKRKEAEKFISIGRKCAREGEKVELWEVLNSTEEKVNGKMKIDSLYDMANWNKVRGMTLREIQDQPVWRILSHNLAKYSREGKQPQLRSLNEHYFQEVGNWIASE